MPLVHCVQNGLASSHFTFLSRHSAHPVLTLEWCRLFLSLFLGDPRLTFMMGCTSCPNDISRVCGSKLGAITETQKMLLICDRGEDLWLSLSTDSGRCFVQGKHTLCIGWARGVTSIRRPTWEAWPSNRFIPGVPAEVWATCGYLFLLMVAGDGLFCTPAGWLGRTTALTNPTWSLSQASEILYKQRTQPHTQLHTAVTSADADLC